MIKEQNVFIKDNSIVPVHDIEERNIGTSNKLIENTKYIQSTETTNEYQTKGKYFMITTKSDHKQAVKEVKAMLKYVYPNRKND